MEDNVNKEEQLNELYKLRDQLRNELNQKYEYKKINALKLKEENDSYSNKYDIRIESSDIDYNTSKAELTQRYDIDTQNLKNEILKQSNIENEINSIITSLNDNKENLENELSMGDINDQRKNLIKSQLNNIKHALEYEERRRTRTERFLDLLYSNIKAKEDTYLKDIAHEIEKYEYKINKYKVDFDNECLEIKKIYEIEDKIIEDKIIEIKSQILSIKQNIDNLQSPLNNVSEGISNLSIQAVDNIKGIFSLLLLIYFIYNSLSYGAFR